MAKRQLLGELLVTDGLITRAQLDAALATQKKLKGRLGSNLVELGFIDLGALGNALSKQFGVPAAQRTDFLLLDKTVALMLPARAAELYKAVPLGRSATNPSAIRVAIADPSNLVVLDEIAVILGAKVEPLVAPEMRILQLQHRLYGLKPVRKTLIREGLQQLRSTAHAGPDPGPLKPESPSGVPGAAAGRTGAAPETRAKEGALAGDRARALQQLLRGRRGAGPALRNAAPIEGSCRSEPTDGPQQPSPLGAPGKPPRANLCAPPNGTPPGSITANRPAAPHVEPRLRRSGPASPIAHTPHRRGTPNTGAGDTSSHQNREDRLPATIQTVASAIPPGGSAPTLVSARDAVDTSSDAALAALKQWGREPLEPAILSANARGLEPTLSENPSSSMAVSSEGAGPRLSKRRRPATEHIALPKGLRLLPQAQTPLCPPELANLAEDDAGALLAGMLPPSPPAAESCALPQEPVTRDIGSAGMATDEVLVGARARAPAPARAATSKAERTPTIPASPRPRSRVGTDPRPPAGANPKRDGSVPGSPNIVSSRASDIPPAALLGRAVERLGRSTTKEEVASAVAEFTASAFGTGLLLIVKGDVALGWRGCSKHLDPVIVEAVMIPLACTSVFQTVTRTGKAYRGAVPTEGGAIVERVWKLLNAGKPEEILLAPVTLRSRVVNLIYTQSVPGRALPITAEADILQLAVAASHAFQNLILQRSG